MFTFNESELAILKNMIDESIDIENTETNNSVCILCSGGVADGCSRSCNNGCDGGCSAACSDSCDCSCTENCSTGCYGSN